MKRVFKRWMAMLLAVLMVMGTLPTTAWAARIEDDAAPATPVVDGKDGVVDTLAKSGKDDDVTPINPVDPDPQPGELNPVKIGTVETPSGIITLGGKDVIATGKAPESESDNVEGIFAIAVLPWFSTEPLPPAANDYVGTYNPANFNSYFPNNNNIGATAETDAEFVGPSFIVKTTSGLVSIDKLDQIELLADGTVRVNNEDYTAVQKAGDALDADKVIAWASGQTTLYHGDDQTAFNPAELGYLPYKVLIGGTSGYAVGNLKIPLTINPLKVKIETKDALARAAFDYLKTNYNASYDAGEHLFTEVTLTNNTDANMTVTLTIKREALNTTIPTNYGNNADITDDSTTAVSTRLQTGLSHKITTTTTGTTTLPLSEIYGLLGNEEDGTNKKWTANGDIVSGNAAAQTELSNIVIPANDSTTIYVAGTKAGTTTKTAANMRRGFAGVTKSSSDSTAVNDFWSSYMITAKITSGEHVNKTVSDTAGIHWVAATTTRPRVRLVYGETNITPDVDTGDVIDHEDTLLGSTGNKKHTVKCDGKRLEYNESTGYYELADGEPVQAGRVIIVDGVASTKSALLNDADVEVPMCKVEVEDEPSGEAGEIKGSYMWHTDMGTPTDPTAKDDAGKTVTYQKVSYLYYPIPRSGDEYTVGVYAKKAGFDKWTGAGFQGKTDGTEVKKVTVAGESTPLEELSGGNPAKVSAGVVNITSAGDRTVTAHYLTPITLVTTYDGKNLGDNSVVNPGDRSVEYVFRIEVTRVEDNAVVAYYRTDSTSGESLLHITKQDGGGAWEIEGLDASKSYTLKINNRQVGSTFLGNKAKDEDTGYNFVVELVGVTPIIEGSTTSASDTLVLPDDYNPNRSRGNVTVTGAAKNTDKAISVYYPQGVGVSVSGGLADGSKISKLTYPSDDDTNAKAVTNNANNTWKLTATNMTFTESGTNPLTATFGATSGAAVVKVMKDVGAYTGLTVELLDDNGDVQATLSSYDSTSGKEYYYESSVTPGEYTIQVKKGSTSVNTGMKVTVTAGAKVEDITNPVTVNFYTVSANVSPANDAITTTAAAGKVTMEVADATKILEGSASQSSTNATKVTAVVLANTSVTWTPDDTVNTHYSWGDWGTGNGNDKPKTEAITAAASYTANFTPEEYEVTYVPNGGTLGDTSKGQFTYGNDYTIDRTPTRTGYTFTNWTAAGGYTGTVADVGKLTKPTGDVTLTAQWTADKYDVKWDGNGGGWTSLTATTKTEQRDYDSVIPKYATDPSRTNYTFDGWYTEATCTNAVNFVADTSPKVTGNVTYYAKWTRITHTLTVQVRTNGSNGFPTDTTYASGLAISVVNKTTAADAPTNPNWTANSSKASETHTVQQGDTYTVSIPSLGYSEDVTIGTSDETVYLDFATISIVTNGHGTAKAEATLPDGTTKRSVTCTESTTAETMQVIETSKVKWTTTDSKANYTFSQWDNTGSKTLADSTVASALISHEAKFTKSSFDTYLDLKVNTVAQAVAADTDDNVKEIKLTYGGTTYSTKDASTKIIYNSTTKKWGITGIATVDGATGTWTVITKDGGTYTEDMVDDGNDTGTATMELFGVKVVDTLPAGCATATVQGGTGSSAASRVVVPRDQAVTAAQTENTGYDFEGWVQAAATPIGNVTPSGTKNAKWTLSDTEGSQYTNTADLEIKPTYTFWVNIKVQDSAGNGLNIQPSTTSGKNGVKQTGDGNYKISGLDPDTATYILSANGFTSTQTFEPDDAGDTVNLTMYKVYTAVNIGSSVNSAKIGKGTTANADEVYIPVGGSTTDTLKVSVTSTNGTGYRKEATTHWTLDKTDKGVSMADVTSAGTAVTVNGITGDVKITANFVQQWTVTSYVTNSTSTPKSKAALEGGAGTGADSSNKSTKTLDAGEAVKITFTPGVGEDLSGWTFGTGTAGKWCATNSSTESDWKDISVAANRPGNTVTEFYFKPTATSTITAAVEPRKYQVEVTVKLDNTGTRSGRTVVLKTDNKSTAAAVYTLTEADATNKPGVYTESTRKGILSGSGNGTVYYIWVDGVETGKTFQFSANEAEGVAADGTTLLDDAALAAAQAKLKREVNYYTVNLAVASGGGGTVAFTSGGGTFKTVLATGGTQTFNVTASPTNVTDAHYRVESWTVTPDGKSGTVPAGSKDTTVTYTFDTEGNLSANTNITKTSQITVTVEFVKQYKVEVTGGRNTAGGSISQQVKVTGDTAADAWKTTVYVDAGETVDLQTKGTIWGFTHFRRWAIADDGGTPTATPLGKGKFQNDTDTTRYDQTYGLRKQDKDNATINPNNLNVFKPEADTVIQLDLWLEPKLSDGGWTYERGVGKDQNDSTKVKQFTWTNNDAKKITTVTVQGTNGNSYGPQELTPGTDYTLSGGKLVLQDSYIDSDSVPKGDYNITVEYILGTTDNEVEELTVAQPFYIKVTPYTLTKVDIGVPTKKAGENYTREPDKTLTMNIHSTDEKTNQVAYLESDKDGDKSHVAKEISKSHLTFTWYWSATSPGASSRPLTAAEIANLNKATPTYPGGATWNKLTSDMTATFTSDGAGGYTAVPTFTSNATNYTNLQGKYVFAVVTASTTGEGSVITNPISVDYDATVIVRQDITPVTDAKAGEYAVYLWPTDGGTFDVTSSKAIQATNTAADGTNNGKYTTKSSALNALKSYYIYVLETESMDKTKTASYVQLKNGNNAVTYSRTTATAPTVDYYTVKVTDMSITSDIKHLQDLKSGVVTAGSAAETFTSTSYPSFTATTGKGVKITSAAAKGVLKGTTVTATANETATNSGIGWTQDYTLAWQDKEGAETSFSDAASKLKQNSSDAVGTGYAYATATNGLSTNVDITGRLEQNYYTIEGNVVDVNRQSGAITSGGGAIQSPKLTAGTTTYAGTLNPTSGGHGAKVSFIVPKAAKDTYTLTATPAANTTMKGYTVPSGTTAPTTVNTSITLGALDAGTTGDALKNRFTIFVVATSLTLSVSDGHEGHEAHSSRTDGVSVPLAPPGASKHDVTVIYDNYSGDPERNQTVTITNDGNTPLNVKLKIEKKKVTDSGWTTVYEKDKTGTLTDIPTSTKKKDTNGVTFDTLAYEYALGLATADKSAAIPVEIPDNLKVADSVTYRFTFNSSDGRDDVDGQGPILTFDLIITVNPVTIGRVTAVNEGGTFKVQHHWLQEDVTRDGNATTAAQINARYAADTPSNHYWAAETIETTGSAHPAERTSMAKLTAQMGNAAADDDDIYYRWYVADPEAYVDWDNKTIGTLKCTNGKELRQVSTATSYTPTDADHGKMLYLVAVGKNNATNAVRTPDEVNFNEKPVPIPYPATITLYENEVSGGANKREKVEAGEKSNYYVWLWNTENEEDFPDDPTVAGSKAIPATAVDGEDGTYTTDVVLYPGKTYQIWVSAYTGCDKKYMRNTGKTVTSVDNSKNQTVDYYLVDVQDTGLSQNDFDDGRLGTIADNSTVFYNDADLGTTVDAAPSAMIPAKGATAATLDVGGKYVLNDTTVTFGYSDRALDYDLIWGGGMTANPDKPSDKNVSHTLTYKDAPKAAVTTQLKLNVYDVVAWVTGSLGSVQEITMTMNDGVDTRIFSTAGGAGKIAGLKNGDTVTSISTTDQNKTFRLPKYESYATVATYDTDVYTLQCYKYEHNGADKGKDNFEVPVTKNTSYDVVLQGEGFSMRVADDVDAQTKKNTNGASGITVNGVYSESSDPKQQDGSQTQTIKLNYNYGADQKVKLTVTNQSQQPKDEAQPKILLHKVTFTPDATAGNPIVVSTDAGDTNTFAGGAVVETMDDTGSATVTLKIPSGLPVGKYEYTAQFSFKTEADATTGANATYKLVVEVEPLTFTNVVIKPETLADGTTKTGKLTIDTYDAERKAVVGETSAQTFTGITPNTTATSPDDDTALKQDPDYGYQWISAPVSMSESDVKAAVSWSNGTLSVDGSTGVKKCTGSGNADKTYTPNDDDAGRNIFLVIYGTDNATATANADRRNATGFAVSNVEKNTYKGMVALKVDGAPKRGKDDADSADPTKTNDGDGYEVVFVNEDTAKTVTAKWTKVGDEYAYVADLEPNTKGYSVKISRARDNATLVVLAGALVTGTGDLATNDIDTNKNNVVEAVFYTVNAVPFTARPYTTAPTDTGEKFTLTGGGTSTTQTSIQPILKLGNDSLDSGTPVLKDQVITAAVSDLGAPNAGKGWTQDYTLTWQDKLNDSSFDTSAAKADDKTTATATTAVSDGYDHGAVVGKTYIGGHLDQNTYTIEGLISGGTVTDQQVKNVTLQETTSNILYYSDTDTTTNNKGISSAAWDDTNNDGKHNSTDKVIFTVVKGSYTITGYEDGNYTIRKVTVDGADPAAGTKRNQNKVENVANSTHKFVIYLEPNDPRLKVTDNKNPANAATSTATADHQFADNDAVYIYKALTGDNSFKLELHNPGNLDLELKAPVLYTVKTGTDYSDSAKLRAALADTTVAHQETLTGNGWTHKDGSRTIVKFESLPAATNDVKIGAGVPDSGVPARKAGTVTVSKDVYNKDDTIYVVKFESKYTTTDGSPLGDHDGPTVYYVLDLTVEPLPIKKVTAEALNDSAGTLQLTGNDLNSVLVDDDRDGKTAATGGTDPIGAATAGLANTDISYVWYSAPTTETVDASDFEFDTTGMKLTAAGAAKGLARGTETGYDSKQYTPSDAEQGLNFYLVAYRANANSNASEFAVSEEVYAQVEVETKAYRTNTTTEVPGVAINPPDPLPDGTTKKSGTDNVFIVAKPTSLSFTADMNDYNKDPDDPAQANYYFVKWGVDPADAATVPTGRDLTWAYPVTKKSTVIGYYDLLPQLKYKNGAVAGGYVIGNDADEVQNDRTLKYEHNDGSGANKVRIFIKPADDGTSAFGGTWAGTTEQELGFSHFDSVNGKTGSSIQFGEDGEYLLSRENLIKLYLKSGSTYEITFYDMERGSKAENGYAGYDRSVTLKITAGNFDVTARAKDVDGDTSNGNQGGNVRLYTTTPEDDSGFVKTDTKTTSGGFIQAEAKPEPGYRFVAWKVLTKDDDDAVANGGDMTPKDGKSLVVSFSPEGEGAILEASFEKAPFTPQNDAKTSVYYGDDRLQATDGKLTVSVTKDTTNGVTQSFSYALATEKELTDYLNGAARPANVYTKDGVEVVPGDTTKNTNVAPAWLKLTKEDNTTASFSVETNMAATGVNVRKEKDASGNLVDVENELVVYLKVTEDNTGEYKLVPVTIDVMTSKLKIVTTQTPDSTEQTDTQKTAEGEAYKTLFAAGEGAIPDHDDKVYFEYFAYTDVRNYYNDADKVDEDGHAHHAAGANSWDKTAGAANDGYGVVTNGYWTVEPKTFDGTGRNEYQADQDITNDHDYVFTFHYTGDTKTDEDNYNYEDTTIILTIPAKVPEMSLKFSDTLKTDTDDGTDDGTKYLLTKGEHSLETADDGYTQGGAPVTLAQSVNASRTDEHITYLDEEPVFHVTLHKVGSLAKIVLTASDDKDGFEVELPPVNVNEAKTTFDVALSELADGLWKGTHTITITAKGYASEDEWEAGDEPKVTATYHLEIEIDPRIITSLDVTVTDPNDQPDTVTPTIDGNPPLNDKGEDKHGNTPIKETTVTWGPETNKPDGKNTEVEVKVEIDPNYIYAKDDDTTPDNEDIEENTELKVTDHLTPPPDVERVKEDEDHIVLITQKIPYLMHDDVNVDDSTDTTGPMVQYTTSTRTVYVLQNATGLGSYTVNLGAYGSDVYGVEWTIEADEHPLVGEGGIGAVLKDSDGNDLTWNEAAGTIATAGPKASFVLDLSATDTSKSGTYYLTLKAAGRANDDENEERSILSTYIFRLVIRPNNPPSPAPDPCPCKVFYHIGSHGTTTNPTVEDVSESSRPSKVPTVTPVDGYTFRGWSLTNPATLKNGEQPVLVEPRTVQAKGESMIFYAVIQRTPFHEHYVIGYPDGTFGPGDDINRASVATIIARAILPDFVEGANYGNPGGYSDVSGHWAESAIAYCSKYGVFEGMPDGTFQPNRPITRQEFALVMARLDGVMKAGEMTFTDADEIASWALDGVYTTYARGWVNGYPDGTFKPMNNIRRDEAVKVFNAYLKRGVDADGLHDLHEYVYPDKNTGNDFDQYKTWPDVPANHWAYYEIIEAANDHAYEAEMDGTYTVPEKWTQCWINERWGLKIADADAAMVSAGFQVWFH